MNSLWRRLMMKCGAYIWFKMNGDCCILNEGLFLLQQACVETNHRYSSQWHVPTLHSHEASQIQHQSTTATPLAPLAIGFHFLSESELINNSIRFSSSSSSMTLKWNVWECNVRPVLFIQQGFLESFKGECLRVYNYVQEFAGMFLH